MKNLKLYILFVLISLIIGVGKAFSTPLEKVNIDELIAENQSTDVVETTVEPIIEEPIKEEIIVEQKVEEPKKQESVKETSKVKEQPKETVKENKPILSDSNKEEPKPVVTKQPWEELGLSEDEYYNKPIMKWQKITHSNMDACKIEGQNTIDDESNEYSNFWCYEVYSPSGKFLGAMLSLS